MLRAKKVKSYFLHGLSVDYDEIAKLNVHSHYLQLVSCMNIDSDHLTTVVSPKISPSSVGYVCYSLKITY